MLRLNFIAKPPQEDCWLLLAAKSLPGNAVWPVRAFDINIGQPMFMVSGGCGSNAVVAGRGQAGADPFAPNAAADPAPTDAGCTAPIPPTRA